MCALLIGVFVCWCCVAESDFGLRFKLAVDLQLALVLFAEGLCLPLALVVLPVVTGVGRWCGYHWNVPMPVVSLGTVIRALIWMCTVVSFVLFYFVLHCGDYQAFRECRRDTPDLNCNSFYKVRYQ